MLTNNYGRFVTILNSSISNGTKVIDKNGAISSKYANNSSYMNWTRFTTLANMKYTDVYNSTNASASVYLAFVLGSGSTSATSADYFVETPIDETNLTLASVSSTYINLGTVNARRNLSATYTYAGTSALTINEVGLIFKGVEGPYDDSVFLIAREVLDSPITVNQGDTFTVSMVIG